MRLINAPANNTLHLLISEQSERPLAAVLCPSFFCFWCNLNGSYGENRSLTMSVSLRSSFTEVRQPLLSQALQIFA
jgi:hypothetical protein